MEMTLALFLSYLLCVGFGTSLYKLSTPEDKLSIIIRNFSIIFGIIYVFVISICLIFIYLVK